MRKQAKDFWVKKTGFAEWFRQINIKAKTIVKWWYESSLWIIYQERTANPKNRFTPQTNLSQPIPNFEKLKSYSHPNKYQPEYWVILNQGINGLNKNKIENRRNQNFIHLGSRQAKEDVKLKDLIQKPIVFIAG